MIIMLKNDINNSRTSILCGVCGKISAHLRTVITCCKSLSAHLRTDCAQFIMCVRTLKKDKVCETAILKDFKSVRKCASRARYLLFFLSRRDNKKNSDTNGKVSKERSTDDGRFALLPTARLLSSVRTPMGI